MKLSRLAAGIAVAFAAGSSQADATFNFSHYWTFSHTAGNGSSALGAEILSFDSTSGNLWVVGTAGIDVLNPLTKSFGFGMGSPGGTPNSVDTYGGVAAVAIGATDKTLPGFVNFYNAANGALISSIGVGANPDMLTFNADGTRVLVANEGEPEDYLPGDPDNATDDPEGSISIIDSSNLLSLTAQTAGFGAFNGQEAALRAAGVRIYGPNATVAQDLEPEYIALTPDGSKAYVTLQENNALAKVDVATATVEAILPLGLKDHSQPGNGFDASDRDGTGTGGSSLPLPGNIQNWPVFGLYQPDAIASYDAGGQTYLVMANEGDFRQDWPGLTEESRVSTIDLDNATFPNEGNSATPGTLKHEDQLGRLTVSNQTGKLDGDADFDQIHLPGARSFSIRDTAGNLVFDSGDAIERILFDQFPSLLDDGRSDNKGPEPEGLALAEIAGRDLLFLGLERSRSVMVWDITDPLQALFLSMLHQAGDIEPEGIATFQMASNWFVGFSNEGSATTTLFQIAPVPVPAALPLFASALVGFGAFRRRTPATA